MVDLAHTGHFLMSLMRPTVAQLSCAFSCSPVQVNENADKQYSCAWVLSGSANLSLYLAGVVQAVSAALIISKKSAR